MTPLAADEAVRLARVEQRVDDLSRVLDAFGPTVTHVATMQVQMTHVQDDVTSARTEIAALREALDTRDAQVSKERKDTRIALWSLVGVLGASLISGAAAIVVAVVH